MLVLTKSSFWQEGGAQVDAVYKFCNLIALILGQSMAKGLRVTKIVKEVKFEGDWGEFELKKRFPETIIHKIFEIDSSFDVK